MQEKLEKVIFHNKAIFCHLPGNLFFLFELPLKCLSYYFKVRSRYDPFAYFSNSFISGESIKALYLNYVAGFSFFLHLFLKLTCAEIFLSHSMPFILHRIKYIWSSMLQVSGFSPHLFIEPKHSQ